MEKLKEMLASQEETLVEIEKQRGEVKAAAAEVSKNFDRLEWLLTLVKKMKKEGACDDDITRAVAEQKASVKGAELEVEV